MGVRTKTFDSVTLATYWFARLADSLESGDALMADAARDKLRVMGFDVRPIGRRRRAPGD